MNQIKIITPKLRLINNIGTPQNSLSKHTLSIIDSGANIHLAQKATTKMAPIIISNDMTASLPDGRKMEL